MHGLSSMRLTFICLLNNVQDCFFPYINLSLYKPSEYDLDFRKTQEQERDHGGSGCQSKDQKGNHVRIKLTNYFCF